MMPPAQAKRFTVWSPQAAQLWLCLFDPEDRETRVPMLRDAEGFWHVEAAGVGPGQRYGLRADGDYDPDRGLWFDPDKLLLDPYAKAIDRPFRYDAALAATRGTGVDTAPLMPKGVVTTLLPDVPVEKPRFAAGGLIYEVSVKAFTKRHPDVPDNQRGTIAALAHPSIVAHLKALHVSAVELMPINAWIDERHLPPLGLTNAWGYNPVSYFALDPRIAPGGMAELRTTVAALRDAGIGVILDMVYNHNGESDRHGPTLSLRGLDALGYFRHAADGSLINDMGTGNSIACNARPARRLILDSLRWFVQKAGVDGFRFDLATALGRTEHGFDPAAPLLEAMRADPVLADRVMIAEPWDIGPGGYRLGQFGGEWLEWNDRYRDDVRRFWRGEPGMLGRFATRLSGSSDIFGGTATRSVNFIAAHDGFPLADLTAFEQRHNHANGEDNRDGHGDNISWNNGVEGPSDDPAIVEARRRDTEALLSTLFLSRGTIMLTAGDEFGRTQQGNNNAYAQDNAITWLDWDNRDRELERYARDLAALRAANSELSAVTMLSDADVEWLDEDGQVMTAAHWEEGDRQRVVLRYREGNGLCLCVNGEKAACEFRLPWGVAAVPGRSLCVVPTVPAGARTP
jgi:glycogen operon protein